MNYLKRAATALMSAAAFVGMAAHAQPQDQPVRIVVGFAPGGATDVLARQVATLLAPKIGRTVIIENKPGASGNIAAQAVSQAPADGSTLLFVPSSHATNASLYKKLPFNTVSDFTSIGLVATTPYVLVVHPQVPAKNVNELVAHLKKSPDRMLYATASRGTGQHIAAEFFKKMAGVEMDQVPYKGSAAAMPDVLAGRTPVMFDNVAVMTPHVKSGAVKALAVTGTKPSALLPGVPPLSDYYSGYEIQGWFALMAPAKTPAATVSKLNTALNAVLKEEAFQKRLVELGAEPLGGSSAEADAYIRSEVDRWAKVIRDANITLD